MFHHRSRAKFERRERQPEASICPISISPSGRRERDAAQSKHPRCFTKWGQTAAGARDRSRQPGGLRGNIFCHIGMKPTAWTQDPPLGFHFVRQEPHAGTGTR